MKNEIYHPLKIVGCECSINSIDYDASDLAIVLDRFDNNQQITIRFKNIYAYRVTLEHFRITEIMDGVTSHPLYESVIWFFSKHKALCHKDNRAYC